VSPYFIGSVRPIVTLINPSLLIFGHVTLLYPTWLCRASKTPITILASFLMTPIPCAEAKSRVSFDWLASSSKLQSYLELCWFAQAPLKTKVAR
jgi:hypothetical protein